MKTRPLSYDVVQLRDISGPRTVARLWCAACGETLDLTLTTSRNADDIERRARAKGWDCDKNRASRTICPDCKVRPRTMVRPIPPKPPAAPRPVVANPASPSPWRSR